MKNNTSIERAGGISGRQSVTSQAGPWPGHGGESSSVKSVIRSSVTGSIQGLCLSQKMDNNAKKETSEASMIINREDMQDIFQIERGEMEL